MSTVSKSIWKNQCNSSQNPIGFFSPRAGQTDYKMYMNMQRAKNNQTVLKKTRKPSIPNIKTYKTTVTLKILSIVKVTDKSVEEIKNSKTDPHIYRHLIYDRMSNANWWGKFTYKINGSGTGWASTYRKKKMEIRPDSHKTHKNQLLANLKLKFEIQITLL